MTREAIIKKNKKISKEIINAVAEYFDADNINTILGSTSYSTLTSDEYPKRSIYFKRTISGEIIISVEYSCESLSHTDEIPDYTSIVLYKLEMNCDGFVTKFKALTPDISYPVELVEYIRKALKISTTTKATK